MCIYFSVAYSVSLLGLLVDRMDSDNKKLCIIIIAFVACMELWNNVFSKYVLFLYDKVSFISKKKSRDLVC
jgi:hypothetical protein